MLNASTTRGDFEKMDIYILVPKHSTPHPTQWVLYCGPYTDTADRRSEERYIFFLIKRDMATNRLSFDFKVQGMPTHFTLGDWKTRRLITSEMAESTEDMARLTEAVTRAVDFPDEVDRGGLTGGVRHWFVVLLEELVDFGWVSEQWRHELVEDIVGDRTVFSKEAVPDWVADILGFIN
ncbi:hypothetical protein BJX66DRAFT_331823 [Aspergillus keveii]|uniref:Uncharacterized protein n=1 Tax=Aspergillus keveii TaxID=714993 RepID=A0ABR4GP88_9EURO